MPGGQKADNDSAPQSAVGKPARQRAQILRGCEFELIIMLTLTTMTYGPTPMNPTECQRCGTCCRNGGPALHGADLDLIRNASIPLSSLYTIRPGEMCTDNISGSIILAESDIIKIKSRDDESVCIFFDETGSACRIYTNRPLECRTMDCRNTETIRHIYDEDRLDRAEILGGISSLSEIIILHEAECDISAIADLVSLRRSGDANAAADITGKINYDARLRKKVSEETSRGGDILDFLFGRPLHRILPLQFGIRVQHNL
jgi:Fe-S-cluster containining protein